MISTICHDLTCRAHLEDWVVDSTNSSPERASGSICSMEEIWPLATETLDRELAVKSFACRAAELGVRFHAMKVLGMCLIFTAFA